jgi:hypothetical protein
MRVYLKHVEHNQSEIHPLPGNVEKRGPSIHKNSQRTRESPPVSNIVPTQTPAGGNREMEILREERLARHA